MIDLRRLAREARSLGLTLAGVWGMLFANMTFAQEAENKEETEQESESESSSDLYIEPPVAPPMEEVVVLGRLIDSAQQLVEERLDSASVSDVLDAESISRLGDSTVAASLRRISGLTLVNNKFVFVRGLGERYSSTTLNGAVIPSPDLTRNVIPLDIFPTSIVESLQVQKSYSADRGAAFGGGAIDIRTKGVPDGLTYSLELGSGYNFQNDGDVFTYPGGNDDKFGKDDGTRALSNEIESALANFAGELDPQSILERLQVTGSPNATIADAEAVNRDLALALNRDISLRERSDSPDYNGRASIGNSWIIGQDWEIGAFLGGSYQTNWRETTSVARSFIFPEQRTDTELESTRNVQINGTANLGFRFTDDHEVSGTTIFLRNTDNETAIRDFFNENRELADGLGFREFRLDFEERTLVVNQAKGTHKLGEATQSAVPQWLGKAISWVPDELEVSWFYSQSRATTEIPNQVTVDAQTVTDRITGEVITSQVSLDARAANYRFTSLNDRVTNYGWEAVLPYFGEDYYLEVSGGYNFANKGRSFRQAEFGLGFTRVDDFNSLQGDLGDVFSDVNILNPENDLAFDRQGTNNQSYLAATITEGAFAKFDYTLRDRWRVSAGARWERYAQVALDLNLFGFTADDPQITQDVVTLEEGTFEQEELYPAVSLTYIGNWWAETFQVRFGWSQTVVRPDLREITDASYIDPITDDLVQGNPGVTPSDIQNFDARAEWFFTSGDNLTVSAFYKDIDNPIEFFEAAASDTNTAREIVNAESAQVYGVEIEALKNLGFIAPSLTGFYVQANVTLQKSELVAGDEADAPTNVVRELAGASEYVVNAQLGFDSDNARHAATVVYNVSGERLFVAGRNGSPDGFEQPFNSLDLTYSWYPTEALTLKAKVQNILDESVRIRRGGVNVFSEKRGTQASLSLKWQF